MNINFLFYYRLKRN